MQCRFIDTGFRDCYENMAIDEAILTYCEMPTLRVYGWKPAAISIGYNQDAKKEINLDYCKKNNIGIVRRLTGGKAVFHDSEITYSFMLPEGSSLVPFEVNESYRVIANALVIALKKIGITAEMKKAPEKIVTPICFNSSNWYELLVNNKKISGSAQRRFNGRILQHGPVLMDFDCNKNSNIFNLSSDSGLAESLKQRITSINHELGSGGKLVGYKELADAIKEGFRENLNFDVFADSLAGREKLLSEKLMKEKYSADEWNFSLCAIK